MNIRVDKNLLVGPLSRLVNITEKRSLMPILSNVLIFFGKDMMNIYSTDLEISAVASVPFKTEIETKIVVHGRKFLDIMKEMDLGEIDLEISGNALTIKQKKTEFVLSLQDAEEFPEVKEVKGKEEFYIHGKAILEMIEKVGFAISTDEARYVLTGMFMGSKEGNISVVGTDGFRMALYQRGIENLKEFKGVIIPKRSLSEIEKIFSEGDSIKVTLDEKHVQFSTENVVLISRIIEGSFPDYENVLPNNKNIATVEKEIFLKGLKKVSTILGRSEPIKVKFFGDRIEMEAESELGRAKETVETEYEGEEISMNFNVRFLVDVVQHIEEEKMSIKAPSTYGAVLIEGKENKEYKNIVMPIRV